MCCASITSDYTKPEGHPEAIVKLNRQRLSIRDTLLRNLIGCAFSTIVVATGFMWAFWDAKRQTWHDKLVGTIVVRDPVE